MSTAQSAGDALTLARQVIDAEIAALTQLRGRLGDSFVATVQAILACQGHVVLSGVGKPLLIAQKIAASMSSTATPSFALHPVDALHGDMGRIRPGDVVIGLSNSGSSPEVLRFFRALTDHGVTRVALTGDDASPLADAADLTLCYGEIQEAGHLGLVPSASTAAMLAMGDALTLVLAAARGLTRESFARFHPAGELGRRLAQAESVMRDLSRTPAVGAETPLHETLRVIGQHRAGAAFVVGNGGTFLGILTDGDLRRCLVHNPGCLAEAVGKHMTRPARTTLPSTPVEEVSELMRRAQIDDLPVVDEAGVLLGHVDILDLA